MRGSEGKRWTCDIVHDRNHFLFEATALMAPSAVLRRNFEE